jgi:hypothetical protein
MRRKELLSFAKKRKWYLVAVVVILSVSSIGVYAQYVQYLSDSDPFYCEADSDCKIAHQARLSYCGPCDPCASGELRDDSIIAFNKNWPKCPENGNADEFVMCAACSSVIYRKSLQYAVEAKCVNNRCEKIVTDINFTSMSIEEMRNTVRSILGFIKTVPSDDSIDAALRHEGLIP